MMERLLSAKDVGRQLGVSPGTVYALAREGRLTHRALTARSVRFTQEDVQEFIDSVARVGRY